MVQNNPQFFLEKYTCEGSYGLSSRVFQPKMNKKCKEVMPDDSIR